MLNKLTLVLASTVIAVSAANAQPTRLTLTTDPVPPITAKSILVAQTMQPTAAQPFSAQPTASQPNPAQPTASQPTVTSDEKSPAIASALALTTTAVGLGLIAAPFIVDMTDTKSVTMVFAGLGVATVGPSMGHFYSGEIKHGLLYSGLRGGILTATTFVAIGAATAGAFGGDVGPGVGIVLVGLGTAAGFGIYDLVDAPKAARRTNARNAKHLQMTVVPQITKNGTAGATIVGTF
ncbi:MAG: hypothetical protein AB7O24_18740 [Kofleriaceae bacterium]